MSADRGSAARSHVGRSECFQESQQRVVRAVAARGAFRCGKAGQDLLLQPQVGVNVDLRRFDALVPQPKSDDGLVDPAVEELHRRAAPQDVRTDALGLEQRARHGGGMDVPLHEVFERVPA